MLWKKTPPDKVIRLDWCADEISTPQGPTQRSTPTETVSVSKFRPTNSAWASGSIRNDCKKVVVSNIIVLPYLRFLSSHLTRPFFSIEWKKPPTKVAQNCSWGWNSFLNPWLPATATLWFAKPQRTGERKPKNREVDFKFRLPLKERQMC